MQVFSSASPIQKIIADHKKGIPKGIYSICSAHPEVIQGALCQKYSDQEFVLFESTCNQVNQDRGYTGMKPEDFRKYIINLAKESNFPVSQILLGGDHLGPSPWKNYPTTFAMEKAQDLVQDYVKAGYLKIHLDTSMACADDPHEGPLDIHVVAQRSADLCRVAETAWENQPMINAPVYVIGTEVPVPGGAENDQEGVQITEPESVLDSLMVYREVFKKNGLQDAWERVIAIVVQPGVEFSQFQIHEYKPDLAKNLSRIIETIPNMVYEAHSTDYQLPTLLRKMVADHYSILKVGPALTFAYRQAVFSLSSIEKELSHYIKSFEPSNLIEIIDQVMVQSPQYWEKYYSGNKTQQEFSRKYSYSDRIRYYWPHKKVKNAYDQLVKNLSSAPIPLSLISQYFPTQYQLIREGKLDNTPKAIIYDHIQHVLHGYQYACMP